jgi:arylformamidase
MMRKWILGGVALSLVATCAVAQRGGRLPAECRREVVQLCGMNRDAIRGCLKEKASQLSENCRGELREMVAKRGGEGRAARAAAGATEFAYGNADRQKLDFWKAPSNRAPVVIFVHGGGWAIGDKRAGTGSKPEFYNGLGYAFASVNYRLVPDVTPTEQAQDVAESVAWLRANSERLGFDPDRIYLMGHSAGAHLVALVSADTRYLDGANVPLKAVRGSILLDGAGYDVVKQMSYKGNRVQSMYDAAFTKDPATQARLSPVTYAGTPDVPNWLILPVASRPDALDQSQSLAKALARGGAKAQVTPVPDATHMSVNQDSGVAGSFVGNAIATFLNR